MLSPFRSPYRFSVCIAGITRKDLNLNTTTFHDSLEQGNDMKQFKKEETPDPSELSPDKTIYEEDTTNSMNTDGPSSSENISKNDVSDVERKPTEDELEGFKQVKPVKRIIHKHTYAMCEECDTFMYERNLRRHKGKAHGAAIEDRCAVTMVDNERGIYLTRKTAKGYGKPVHVQRTKTLPPIMDCEIDVCREASHIAKISGGSKFECRHLSQLMDAEIIHPEKLKLSEEALHNMIKQGIIEQQNSTKLLMELEKAQANKAELIVEFKDPTTLSDRYIFTSVYTGYRYGYCRLERTVVTLDKQNMTWHCSCRNPTRPPGTLCLHKHVMKWFIFMKYPKLLQGKTTKTTNLVHSE